MARTHQQHPHINRTSKLIYEQRKTAAFTRIFDHLSSESGGERVVEWRIDSASIDPGLLPVIRPLVEEI